MRAPVAQLDRASGYEPSENYKPFLWRRLRARPFVTRLLNCTEDVPQRTSDSTRAENSNLTWAHEPLLCCSLIGLLRAWLFARTGLERSRPAANASRGVVERWLLDGLM